MTVLALHPNIAWQQARDMLTACGCDPQLRHDREGREYMAHRCAHPDHRDSVPSATTTQGPDGRVLFNCFSCAPPRGDPQRARWVAQVVGRLLAGAPKEPPDPTRQRARSGTGPTGHGTKVAHYDYTDADGTLIARKVRFQPKSFLWQRPHGQHWADGLRGKPLAELPPYGLQTLDRAGPVYVVEGEKDADRVASLGHAAICAAGSHPDNLPTDLTVLTGRVCIVVADRDPVGIRLAHAWAERLAAVPGAAIALAQPAVNRPKADVSDHLDAGLTLQQLDFGPVTEPPGAGPDEPSDEQASADIGPLASRIDWHAAYRDEDHDVDWLVDGIIERGRLIALYSAPKAGKSLLALDWAAALATGHNPDGTIISVLYCDYENTPGDVVDRLRDLGYHDPAELDQLHYLSLPNLPPLDTPAGGDALLAAARTVGAQLVIIDTASRSIRGEENAADTWNAWYSSTGIKLKRDGIALLRLDHSGKDEKKGQRGSSAKAGDVDLVLHLVADGDRLELVAEQRRQSYYLEHVSLRRVERDGRLTHEPTTRAENGDRAVNDLIALLATAGLPAHAGRPTVKAWLDANGYRVTKRTLEQSLRIRRGGRSMAGQPRDAKGRAMPKQPSEPVDNPVDCAAQGSGQSGGQAASRAGSPTTPTARPNADCPPLPTRLPTRLPTTGVQPGSLASLTVSIETGSGQAGTATQEQQPTCLGCKQPLDPIWADIRRHPDPNCWPDRDNP